MTGDGRFVITWIDRINILGLSALKQQTLDAQRYASDGSPIGSVITEIGRASCRERVCQYGYISVDAVSFKKNTTRAISPHPHTNQHTPHLYPPYPPTPLPHH